MTRWYITGGAGSGKSTLASALARPSGVPHHDVDLGSLPASSDGSWVVEGAHLWDMEQFVAAADSVVWLDLPMRVCVRRILVRHLRRSRRGDNPHPGLRSLLRFVRSQPRYYRAPARPPTGPTDWEALTRAGTEAMLRRARGDDVIRLRRPREVRAFLVSCHLPTSRDSRGPTPRPA